MNQIEQFFQEMNQKKEFSKQKEYYYNTEIPKELDEYTKTQEYKEIEYNKQNEDAIIKKFKLPEEWRKAIGTFVYFERDTRRKQEKEEHEQNIIKQGYEKVSILDHKRIEELNGKKIKGIFFLNTIGLMGSYDKETEQEGTIKKGNQGIFLIPKRSRTRGYQIRNHFFLKEMIK